MAEPPFDVAKDHRWFAIEFNNLAWELVEKPDRSAEETERLIHAAHASCFHWLHVGTAINQQRGECLLATAYAAAGHAEAALRHANRCAEINATGPDGQNAFDRATAHGCLANALALSGRRSEAEASYAQAIAAAATFDHPDERPIFDTLYPAPN